jgi:hypothetical protein
MSKMLDGKLANKVMGVFLQNGFGDKVASPESDVREGALDEALGVMVVVSARMTAALLIEHLRNSEDPSEIDDLATNIAGMFSMNFNQALTTELISIIEKVQAMAEKSQLEQSSPNKPTTH